MSWFILVFYLSSRAKKKQFISKETQRIDHDAAVDTEEAHFIDSAKLNFDPCNPFTRESIDPSDIMTASAQSSKTPEINNDSIDVQISVRHFYLIFYRFGIQRLEFPFFSL